MPVSTTISRAHRTYPSFTKTSLHRLRYAPSSVLRVTQILLLPSFLLDLGPVAFEEVGTVGYGRFGVNLMILGFGFRGALTVTFRRLILPDCFPFLPESIGGLVGSTATFSVSCILLPLGNPVTIGVTVVESLGPAAVLLHRRLTLSAPESSSSSSSRFRFVVIKFSCGFKSCLPGEVESKCVTKTSIPTPDRKSRAGAASHQRRG